MVKFSKEQETAIINERQYRFTKWSVFSTMLEGKRLAKPLALLFASVTDTSMNAKKAEEAIESWEESEDEPMPATTAATVFFQAFSDEHFMDLMEKLLTNLEFRVRGDDGEFGDFKKIEDTEAHFTEFFDDVSEVAYKSARLNLYNFFMGQPIFRSKITSITEWLAPILLQVSKSINEGTSLEL